MDSVTHTLFGLTLYGAVNKEKMDKNHKRAYFVTAVSASLIPDIDVISQLWDTEGQYQMWHRGLTHSIFLTPIWAAVIFLLCMLLFKVKDKRLFFLAWIAVIIHNTSDLFNAWGTGYLEPFSEIRITFGTIPIVDLVFWVIMGVAFLLSRRNRLKAPFYFKMAWVFIAVHVMIQSTQGYFLYNQYDDQYEQVALSAGFVPWTYSIITKDSGEVTIFKDNIFQEREEVVVLKSNEEADLDYLFSERPEAETLYKWSPFVVIVDDGKQLGLYDPRFYRNGQSFLFESIERNIE